MIIFDIQRNSIVDGPGIRTTVFFKGCNLRCKWCHNPESQFFEPQILFDETLCKKCGMCLKVCPNGTADINKCILCGKCEIYCLAQARRICGKEYSKEEVMREVLADRLFYETSGGGVTFSGGECMLQIDSLAKLLKLCKSEGIHTAVDTAGCVSFESFEKIMPYTDLFLFDIKAFTPELHKDLTGVDNCLILDNYIRLLKCKKRVFVRIPVVGDGNFIENEFEKISDFLKKYPPEKVELLPYHNLGNKKYVSLRMEKPNFYIPSSEQMNRLTELFEKH